MLGNVIPGSDRIPGSRNTAASATKSLPNTRSEVSAKLKFFQLSNIAKEILFIGPALWKNGNSEENGLLTMSLADTCMRALSSVLVVDMSSIAAPMSYQISNTGKTLNEGKCFFFQHGKSSMLGNVIPGSDRISGSMNTTASATKQSSSHKV